MGENDKASRYIAQLDEARCSARWHELPELARKIEKHAPHRACLAVTARAEAQIATHNEKRPSNAPSAPGSELTKLIPSLLTAVDHESDYAQDAFQAATCLGWLHWVLDEPHLAVARFPKDFNAQLYKLSSSKAEMSGWTKVCIVKGAYMKGFSQEKDNHVAEGVQTYCSVLPFLSSLESLSSASPQLKQWTEWLLSRLCLLSDQSSPAAPAVDSAVALQVFRIWGRLFEVKPSQMRSAVSTGAPATSSTRRRVWKAYYDTLSAILQHDLEYKPSGNTLATFSSNNDEKEIDERLLNVRLLQRAELKRVETLYEAQLLEETQFPGANQSNTEIELWADSVIDNWRVLCGSTWRDEDLGEGGKSAVGREVLDILYRAATKTFHSTQILRHLFTVHASLAEFDLAFKAFDSYVEIVSRGKERAAKSGEVDLAIDDDSMILRTCAEAVRILCRFGGRKEAEKARDIGQFLEGWLKQHTPPSLDSSLHSGAGTIDTTQSVTEINASPVSKAVAYRAIGISQAQWARMTYDAPSRNKIQADATRNLGKSLDPKLDDPYNIEGLFALALVMAEMRDISGAIKLLKRALSQTGGHESTVAPDGVVWAGSPAVASSEYIRERKLIPLWHLLSLLLTARSEFFTASKACEAAFEQFQDPAVLFGQPAGVVMYKSSHLNELRMAETFSHKGLVDRMEPFEKEGVIQVKLTQLALVEAVEGAAAAVDASDELLALYGRLFGEDTMPESKQEAPATAKPPKSSAGTIRGNIFRRPKTAQQTSEVPPTPNTPATAGERPVTAARVTPAPAIQVTDEDSVGRANGSSLSRQKSRRDGSSTPRRSESTKLRKKSMGSLRQPPSRDPLAQGDAVEQEDEVPPLSGLRGRANSVNSRNSRRKANQSISSSVTSSFDNPDQPLHETYPLPSHPLQSRRQDVRLPAPFPRLGAAPLEPRFPVLQERQHRFSLLVELWLFIGGLYGRAGLFDDAKEAIEEARKIVDRLEEEVLKESPNSKALSDRGWGVGKSVQELWGDVGAARGELNQAQGLPHAALGQFEGALSHFPDHPSAIVGLSSILLDIYCEIIPPELPHTTGALAPSLHASPANSNPSSNSMNGEQPQGTVHAPTPSELNRLSARDRAYEILSSLTKLGSGWDYSEAWFVLARAYEEGGQVEKAKEVLWWCVELEDTKPLRHWSSIGRGGIVL